MKKVFVVVLAGLLIGCGARESVGAKNSTNAPASKDYVSEGINYLKDANAADAIKSFQLAIKSNPSDSKAYLILGETYMHMKAYDRAEQILSAGLRTQPDNGNMYYMLAVSQGLAGDKEEAKVSAQKSILLFQQQKNIDSLKKSVAFYRGLESSQ